MIIRVINDNLGRSLHPILYTRIKAFCEQYSPGFPSDTVATGWLSRVYMDDPLMHILVDFDESSHVVGHSVIEVQGMHGNPHTDHVIVHCYQTQHDNPDLPGLHFGFEYMDKLILETNAICGVIVAQVHARALTRYGYKPIGALMVRCRSDVVQNTQSITDMFEADTPQANGLVSLH